jgi:hypothetical protein
MYKEVKLTLNRRSDVDGMCFFANTVYVQEKYKQVGQTGRCFNH